MNSLSVVSVYPKIFGMFHKNDSRCPTVEFKRAEMSLIDSEGEHDGVFLVLKFANMLIKGWVIKDIPDEQILTFKGSPLPHLL